MTLSFFPLIFDLGKGGRRSLAVELSKFNLPHKLEHTLDHQRSSRIQSLNVKLTLLISVLSVTQ